MLNLCGQHAVLFRLPPFCRPSAAGVDDYEIGEPLLLQKGVRMGPVLLHDIEDAAGVGAACSSHFRQPPVQLYHVDLLSGMRQPPLVKPVSRTFPHQLPRESDADSGPAQ